MRCETNFQRGWGRHHQDHLSFFSSRRVFWVNFELVLARDDTVNASADRHENLLIALKGGSNNFGIVTRFHMTTFEQGKLWGGDVHYGTDQFFPASAGVSGLHHRRGVRTIMCTSFSALAMLPRSAGRWQRTRSITQKLRCICLRFSPLHQCRRRSKHSRRCASTLSKGLLRSKRKVHRRGSGQSPSAPPKRFIECDR